VVQTSSVTVAQLSRFRPLCFLSPGELHFLAEHIHVDHALAGQQLISVGSEDPRTLFVLEGQVDVRAGDGRGHRVSVGEPHADEPISHLLPHRFKVTAASDVDYILVEHHLLENALARQFKTEQVHALQLSGGEWSHPVFLDIYQQVESDTLRLPPLPEVAMRMQRIRGDEDIHTISKIISADPVVTVILIRVANSPFYMRAQPVQSVEQALSVLGLVRAKSYILSYALGSLHQSKSAHISSQLHKIWEHCVEVGSIAHALASRHKQFEPDHAMLLGLVHDLGVLPILYYADMNHITDARQVEKWVDELHGSVGKVIMSKWGFGDDFIQMPLEADNWLRDPADQADYCDVVMVAQLLSFLGRDPQSEIPGMRFKTLPRLADVPAFAKLGLAGQSAKACLELLQEAHAEMEQTLRSLR